MGLVNVLNNKTVHIELRLVPGHPEATSKIRMINRKNRSNVFRHPELAFPDADQGR